MQAPDRIDAFLAGRPHAVAGASTDRGKFGNRVLRAYLRHGMEVYAVNPRASEVEGIRAYPDVLSLPDGLHGISIVTPPPVTEEVVEQAIRRGIRHLWMQPGAESAAAVRRAVAAGLSLVHGGPCLLVELPRRR
jgi:predicted CoA-binding protein